MKNNFPGEVLTVPLLAISLLAMLSVLDWDEISGGKMTNFNLLEDLLSADRSAGEIHKAAEIIDPSLEDAINEVTSEAELPVHDIPANNITQQTEVCQDNPGDMVRNFTVSRIDSVLPIEDYSPDGNGLRYLKAALAACSERRTRIAVIGDSYIEGDIFTQDIRRLLQDEFGGRGVGYMSMHSDFPGFRRSVHQADQGWEVRDMRNFSGDGFRPLSGEYCVGVSGATLTLRGSKIANVGSWSSTKLLFQSDNDGVLTIKADGCSKDYSVSGSDRIQMIELPAETTKITFVSAIEGINVFGAWVEDNIGVWVDCMSLRGNSGASHRLLSTEIAHEMNLYIPYNLIIIEYGLNALSAEQSDYTRYGMLMEKVVDQIRECYPDCDILLMGVGDRGRKSGTVITSLPTVDAMVQAQRSCARNKGIMFWDTREAMGGKDAVVEWRKRGLLNADYIHLNHKGGAELAKEFVNSLKMKLDESR